MFLDIFNFLRWFCFFILVNFKTLKPPQKTVMYISFTAAETVSD